MKLLPLLLLLVVVGTEIVDPTKLDKLSEFDKMVVEVIAESEQVEPDLGLEFEVVPS